MLKVMKTSTNVTELEFVELSQEELCSIDGGGAGKEIGRLIGYCIAAFLAYTEAVRESNSQIAWYDKK